MKFVHAADIHLDSPLRGLQRYDGAPLQELRGATRRALQNLVQLCLDESVDLLLIAGDLYDGEWRDYNTGLFFIQQIALLSRANIPVVLLRGNHDAQSQISKHLHLPDTVMELSTDRPQTILFEKLGVAVHGQGYSKRDIKSNLVKDYPERWPDGLNIGLLHTALDGREGHAPYAPCSIDDLIAKRYDYWALGHVHQREILCEDPWIVFPGNLQGRHIRETGAKGATLVNVADGAIRDVTHRALDVLRWQRCEVAIDGLECADDVLDRIKERLRNALSANENRLLAVRLYLHGSGLAHQELVNEPEYWRNEIRAAIADLDEQIWLENIQFYTRAAVDLDALTQGDDPLAGLLTVLRELPDDQAELKRLLDEFSSLKTKLPPEYHSLDDALDFNDPQTLKPLLDDIAQLLLPRLLALREDE